MKQAREVLPILGAISGAGDPLARVLPVDVNPVERVPANELDRTGSEHRARGIGERRVGEPIGRPPTDGDDDFEVRLALPQSDQALESGLQLRTRKRHPTIGRDPRECEINVRQLLRMDHRRHGPASDIRHYPEVLGRRIPGYSIGSVKRRATKWPHGEKKATQPEIKTWPRKDHRLTPRWLREFRLELAEHWTLCVRVTL